LNGGSFCPLFGVGGNLLEVVGSFFSSGYYFLLVEKSFPGSPSPILPENVILLNKGGPHPTIML